MFTPKFHITSDLLEKIKQINLLIHELNRAIIPEPIKLTLQREAREISVYSSTKIEGNPLSLTQIKQILKQAPENIETTEQEIINYNNALEFIFSQVKSKKFKLDENTILLVHKKVTQNLLPPYQSGAYRRFPIEILNPITHEPVFLPPDWQDVPTLMKELLDFVNNNSAKLDPIIVAGVFHKQMVLIHPFMDGNGRTTRLLTTGILAISGIKTINLFSFEEFYNRNVTRYFQYVGETGDYYELKDNLDFTPWLEYFAEGILTELKKVLQRIKRLDIKKPILRLQPHLRLILNYIRKHGSITSKECMKITKRSKASCALDFKRLLKLKLIKRRGRGKATYYVLND